VLMKMTTHLNFLPVMLPAGILLTYKRLLYILVTFLHSSLPA
jgi:hypothetical protein